MTVLKINALERGDMVRLAGERGKGLTLTPLGDYPKFINGVERVVHCWVVDRVDGDHQRFHDVDIWTDGRDWYGECDSLENEPDDERACKANRLGGRLCSHLAMCLLELEDNNKILLSFVGSCDHCNREGVRVAFDGEAYACLDQHTCHQAKAEMYNKILAEQEARKDNEDVFG